MHLVAVCCFQFIKLKDPDEVQTGPKRHRAKERTPTRSGMPPINVLPNISGQQRGSNAFTASGQALYP